MGKTQVWAKSPCLVCQCCLEIHIQENRNCPLLPVHSVRHYPEHAGVHNLHANPPTTVQKISMSGVVDGGSGNLVNNFMKHTQRPLSLSLYIMQTAKEAMTGSVECILYVGRWSQETLSLGDDATASLAASCFHCLTSCVSFHLEASQYLQGRSDHAAFAAHVAWI